MKPIGPWKCELCGQLSQYAYKDHRINKIFCVNPSCRFERLIDKHDRRIVENDGTVWEYDGNGNKRQVRAR